MYTTVLARGARDHATAADSGPGTSLLGPAGDVGVIDLWMHRTHKSGDLSDDLVLLDSTERNRADRFRFERDRRRYVQRHAFARRVLGRYLSLDAADIVIRIAPRGKPELDGPHGLSFNLSQAADMTVLAVADGRPVGVDLERVRAIDEVRGLAKGLFAVEEIEALRSQPPASRSTAFLKLWTRKEALVKAVGDGLWAPLDGFTVLMRTGEKIGRPRDAGGAMPFAFAPLDGLPGFVGTAASAGESISVRSMDERRLDDR